MKAFRLLGQEKRHSDLEPHLNYRTFGKAVEAGQQAFGFGLFHVECPEDYVPSREEQLLIKTQTRKTILNSL